MKCSTIPERPAALDSVLSLKNSGSGALLGEMDILAEGASRLSVHVKSMTVRSAVTVSSSDFDGSMVTTGG